MMIECKCKHSCPVPMEADGKPICPLVYLYETVRQLPHSLIRALGGGH